jgi:hypothetical protein
MCIEAKLAAPGAPAAGRVWKLCQALDIRFNQLSHGSCKDKMLTEFVS